MIITAEHCDVEFAKEVISMTQQTKLEIIKALACGLDIATVAACNGVAYAEAEQIALQERTAVQEKRAELKEAYPDEL